MRAPDRRKRETTIESTEGGSVVAKRLNSGRREELLEGVMQIIGERGFSEVRISEMARELKCSATSLYKIAPDKHSLVIVAIAHWAGIALSALEDCMPRSATASERARCYWLAGARAIHPLSVTFWADIGHFDSTKHTWQTLVVDPFVERFVELVQSGVDAGEIRPVNIRFLAETLQAMSVVLRDESALRSSGLSSERGMMELDALVWEGILAR